MALLQSPLFFQDAIYLKSPSRIDAPLWQMNLALLVYAAMEYKIRKALAYAQMVFPLSRGFQYVDHLRIQIIRKPDGTDYM